MIKILIVDDIEMNRALLKQALMIFGDYEIIEAVDGVEAVACFEIEKPDLILMDIMMPDIDGCEAARIMKGKMGDEHTPIIFITALSEENALSRALESGGDDFICKPFDMEILKSKINVHLRIKKLNKQLVNYNQQLVNEQELIEHFFETAINQSYLDEKLIRYHMSSVSTFNGDLLLVERAPHGGVYLVMGDFSGHGLGAAMGTLPVAMIFFKMVLENRTIGDIACEINSQLRKIMPSNMFFTATLLELNAKCDVVTVWMGGMPDSYCLHKNGELKHTISSKHMPLGILDDSEFDSSVQSFNVQVDDKFYIYSDGVIEAKNKQGEQFGDARLEKILMSKKDNVFNEVLEELTRFTGRNNQNDDITLVEFNCLAIPAEGKQDINDGALAWSFSVSLCHDDMRETDPIDKILILLGGLPQISRHRDILKILLSEIYSNCLEHSILNMRSSLKTDEEQFGNYYKSRKEKLEKSENASIDFDFSFSSKGKNDYLEIKATDNGQGFVEQKNAGDDDSLYGRGLNILKNFSEKMWFSNDGKVFNLWYKL